METKTTLNIAESKILDLIYTFCDCCIHTVLSLMNFEGEESFRFCLTMQCMRRRLVKRLSLHDWCHEGVMHSNALVTRLCNALRDGGRV